MLFDEGQKMIEFDAVQVVQFGEDHLKIAQTDSHSNPSNAAVPLSRYHRHSKHYSMMSGEYHRIS